MKGDKRAAMEMSVGTIVTIVLSMMMLIGGIVLIKSIIDGSKDNILTVDSKVKDQIGKLFVEDKKTVVYTSNNIAKIKQGEEWGIAFGIKNLERGTAEDGKFEYEVVLADPESAERKCGITEREIMDWIVTGRTEKDISIAPGDFYSRSVRFLIPESSPLCIIRFNLKVTKEGSSYATDFFDVDVLS